MARKKMHEENPISTTAKWLIGAGILGATAVAYELLKSKPAASSSSSTTTSSSSSSSSPAPTPTPPSTTTTTTTTTTPNNNAYTGQDGQTFTMAVGDTISVDLSIADPVAGYTATPTGSALTAGSPSTTATDYTVVYTAASTGTETVSFQGTDSSGNASGSPVSFTATVS